MKSIVKYFIFLLQIFKKYTYKKYILKKKTKKLVVLLGPNAHG